MKNTKLVALLIAILFLFCTAEGAFASVFDTIKDMIVGEEDLSVQNIVKETQDIKDEVKELSDDYVIKSIKKYNSLISQMRSEVNSKSWYVFKKDDAEKFNIIINGIGKIKDLYVGLKKDKIKVKEKMRSYIEDIKKFNEALKHKIPEEIRIKEDLERQYNSIDSNASYTHEEKEIKKKGLQKRIGFADRRIKLRNEFKNNYQRIIPVMKSADKSIGRFIFVIEESADVYTDAYNTLKLQRDINNAYRTIEELKSLDYLSEDIMKSWANLENIVKVLTDQVVGFDKAG